MLNHSSKNSEKSCTEYFVFETWDHKDAQNADQRKHELWSGWLWKTENRRLYWCWWQHVYEDELVSRRRLVAADTASVSKSNKDVDEDVKLFVVPVLLTWRIWLQIKSFVLFVFCFFFLTSEHFNGNHTKSDFIFWTQKSSSTHRKASVILLPIFVL